MKFDTIVEGLSDLINDYIEGNLDAATADMLETYFEENARLEAFVENSKQGKLALKKAFQVRAANDFESKLAEKIYRLNQQKEGEVG